MMMCCLNLFESYAERFLWLVFPRLCRRFIKVIGENNIDIIYPSQTLLLSLFIPKADATLSRARVDECA